MAAVDALERQPRHTRPLEGATGKAPGLRSRLEGENAMTRTTTPDKYTPVVKQLCRQRRAGLISRFVFAVAIERIWNLRHAGA